MEAIAFISLIGTATGTILVGARRAYSKRQIGGNSMFSITDADTQVITLRHALLFPFVGSITLMIMFLFFKYLSWFFLAYIIALSLGSIAYCIHPVVQALCTGPPSCLRPSPNTAATMVGSVTVLLWVLTGHWALNNIIGIGVCVALISVMRLPSLKIATVALVGLLFYDIYWVFLSAAHFNESVMVAVAKQEASNPASVVANAMPGVKDLPAWALPAPTLQMPNKLSIPVWVLVDTRHLEEEERSGARYPELAASEREPGSSSGGSGSGEFENLPDVQADAAVEAAAGASAPSGRPRGTRSSETAEEAHERPSQPHVRGARRPITNASTAQAAPQAGQEGRHRGDGAGAGGSAKRPRIALADIYILHVTATLGAVFAGFTFLGLGDIALPGLLLAYAHRIDLDKEMAAEEEAIQHAAAAAAGAAIAPSLPRVSSASSTYSPKSMLLDSHAGAGGRGGGGNLINNAVVAAAAGSTNVGDRGSRDASFAAAAVPASLSSAVLTTGLHPSLSAWQPRPLLGDTPSHATIDTFMVDLHSQVSPHSLSAAAASAAAVVGGGEDAALLLNEAIARRRNPRGGGGAVDRDRIGGGAGGGGGGGTPRAVGAAAAPSFASATLYREGSSPALFEAMQQQHQQPPIAVGAGGAITRVLTGSNISAAVAAAAAASTAAGAGLPLSSSSGGDRAPAAPGGIAGSQLVGLSAFSRPGPLTAPAASTASPSGGSSRSAGASMYVVDGGTTTSMVGHSAAQLQLQQGQQQREFVPAQHFQSLSNVSSGPGAGVGGGLRGVLYSMYWAFLDTLLRPTYLRTSFLGYVAGLILSIFMSRTFNSPQPALLYLVPCTLIPLCLHAAKQKELLVLWTGTAATLHSAAAQPPTSSVSSGGPIGASSPSAPSYTVALSSNESRSGAVAAAVAAAAVGVRGSSSGLRRSSSGSGASSSAPSAATRAFGGGVYSSVRRDAEE